MISNVFLNKSNENISFMNFIDNLNELETLDYLKNNNLISMQIYEKAILRIKKFAH